MLYNMVYNTLYALPNKMVARKGEPLPRDGRTMFTELLKNCDDEFAFILTPEQWSQWEADYKTLGWGDFLFFDMGEYVKNPNYPKQPPRLRLVILKGKKQ